MLLIYPFILLFLLCILFLKAELLLTHSALHIFKACDVLSFDMVMSPWNHSTARIMNISITLKFPSYLFVMVFFFLFCLLSVNHWSIFYYYILTFPAISYKWDLLWYCLLLVVSFTIHNHLSLIHVVYILSFFYTTDYTYSIVWVYQSMLFPSSVGEHLSFPYVFALINKAATNISIKLFV